MGCCNETIKVGQIRLEEENETRNKMETMITPQDDGMVIYLLFKYECPLTS